MTSNKPKIIAMIPARRGSTRLKEKNLALLGGKPLISYAIEAAKGSGAFDRIVVNSEDTVFEKLAKRHDVEFYHRPSDLGSSQAKSDEVIKDFMTNDPCDVLAWVNPTSPLQPAEEIKAVINHFIKERLDSLITVKNEQVHCMFRNKPLNFNMDELFAKTQDLEPVQPFVYSIMVWRCEAFLEEYKKKGHALLCGTFGTYPVGHLSNIVIKKEEDLKFAEYVLTGMKETGDYELKYDEVASR